MTELFETMRSPPAIGIPKNSLHRTRIGFSVTVTPLYVLLPVYVVPGMNDGSDGGVGITID